MSIRRFEEGNDWVEFDGDQVRSSFFNGKKWQAALTVNPQYLIALGFKEVFGKVKDNLMQHDPNDLQNACPHVYEASTDSCALCHKAWDSIMFDTHVLKSCCDGGIGKPALWSGGKWHDSTCPEVTQPAIPRYDEIPDKFKIEHDFNRYKPSINCVCGAQATSNPNCHSTWCGEYKK